MSDLRWDQYVYEHPEGSCFHLLAWLRAIRRAYGNGIFCLMARTSDRGRLEASACQSEQADRVVGILPLVQVKHLFSGSHLVSTPFLDSGGVLADNQFVEKLLVDEAMKIAQETNAQFVELRQRKRLSWIDGSGAIDHESNPDDCHLASLDKFYASKTLSHKVRMVVDLPESSEILMSSFKSKLRSQIRKPIKEGLTAGIGGTELLDDFYQVFAANMRDLGSPVHSKHLISNVLGEFKEECKIIVIYDDDHPVAGTVVMGFKQVLYNPWASALRQYNRLSPNMLLYWTMLEYACDQGFKHFDFGRSTPDENTYKFKEQWGSKPLPLNWHFLSVNGSRIHTETKQSPFFRIAIRCWQRLPIPLTRAIGPRIRKHIAL